MAFSPAGLLSTLQALPDPPCYWVAYSGGLDSHVLLHAMAQISGHLSGSIQAIHVHHGLQTEADLWQQHAMEVSRHLGIELTPLRLNLQPVKGESLEAVARDARYRAIQTVVGAGDLVLTAQHQNDQAETLLLQLMRGSGPSGLAAMPALAPFNEAWLARPLLAFTRAELTAYAEQHGLCWIEDGSNADLRFDRNYIRHQLMPLIEQRWPACSATMARSARHCAEAQQLIGHLALQDYVQVQCGEAGKLSVVALNRLSPPRCRAVLRHWIERGGFRLPSTVQLDRIITEVLVAAEDRAPLVVWAGAEVHRFRDRLSISSPLPVHDPAATLAWSAVTALQLPAGLGVLSVEARMERGICADLWRHGSIEVRFRQGGERCRRQGEKVSRSLKRIFQEVLQIPPWLRDRVPLIYINGELAAVAGYFVCEPFVVSPGEPGMNVCWEADVSIASQLAK
ncbi:MAG: tRNA lysidine(34) synthetase TilS [Candidatus Polarisedimenticolaceae bacterium]|nr:tRNA lysidine(34) synthetase TilS [Candidatus Polarisedimenticolaceae bacterium]